MRRRVVLLLAVMTMALVAVASPAWADTTFTVNSTGDEGDDFLGDDECATEPFPIGTVPNCTLRAAIEEANATTDPDTIEFVIGGSGVKTISPSSSLPEITQPVTIDGYTEPGASENTLAVGNNAVLRIRLDGLNAGSGGVVGLSIRADDSVVRGLSVTRFSSSVGILLSGADNTRIEGNFLGTNPGGTQDRGNAWGVYLSRPGNTTNTPTNNTVGGTSPEDRNIISGNSVHGVEITSGEDNRVIGNYIGTTKSGTGNLGNSFRGVSVVFEGANNTIGGAAGARNTIAFNGGDGVRIGAAIFDDDVTGNSILGNSIFSNEGLGIDLSPTGVTPNDGVGDADTGPNNLQNFPVLNSAKTGLQTTTIKGTLESAPARDFTIQFFSNPESTRDEGKKFIGQKSVTDTDGDGIISFTFKPTRKVTAGMFVTSTATSHDAVDPTKLEDTSEFSAPKKVLG